MDYASARSAPSSQSPPPSTVSPNGYKPPYYPDSPVVIHRDPKDLPEVVPPGMQQQHFRPPMTHPGGAAHQDSYSLPWAGNPRPDEKRTRSTRFWVCLTALIALVIIVILAGILGAVASGSIKTSANSSQNPPATVTVTTTWAWANPTQSGGPSATPSVSTTTVDTSSGKVTIECPSADGLEFTSPGTRKKFKRVCNANYPGGDGALGLQNGTFLSMPECINACALRPECVGVAFNYSPQCWLKEALGLKNDVDGTEMALLIQ